MMGQEREARHSIEPQAEAGEGLAAEGKQITGEGQMTEKGQITEADEAERQRILRRKRHMEEMRRLKRRTEILHRCALGAAAAALAAACVGVCALVRSWGSQGNRLAGESVGQEQPGAPEPVGLPETTPDPGGHAGIGGILEKVQEYLQAEGTGPLQAGTEVGDGSALQAEGDGGGGSGGAEAGGEPGESLAGAFEACSTAVTEGFGEEIVSQYGVLIDVASQTILAGKECHASINPASMTKILTVLTAADALGVMDGTEAVLDDFFTMTIDITDYSYVNDCSIVGFQVDEKIPVRDLFYGTVLPSGADAAVGLAIYTAGSQEAFVELMNRKLEILGLADSTHFTNCVGLYDDAHYSTVYDIAVILKEAADNPFCRQVLSAHTYNTALTEQHPEGILLSNWFLRRIEDRDTHGEVLCGKTGFVDQSGSCAASLSVDKAGKEYLCVTAGSSSSWQCIDDQHMLYEKYLPVS